MMRIGGFDAFIVRICTGEVWVRSSLPPGPPRAVGTLQIEGVVHLARRMLGRDVEGGEVVEVVLDVRPLGDARSPSTPKMATISSMVWLMGWRRPSASGRAGSVTSTRSVFEALIQFGIGEALIFAPRWRRRPHP